MRRSRLRRLSLLLATALAASGCGGGSDEPAPLAVGSQPLAGKIAGTTWTFAHGDTNAFLSSGSTFFTKLFADGVPGCGGSSPSSQLILNVPKAPGDYTFSTQLTGTFYTPPSTNLIATRGRIIVEQVGAASVTARVHMIFDAANEIDGEFVASVCP